AKAASENAIPDAELSSRGLSVSPIREEESDKIKALSRKLYMLVPRIRITSLLAEVHSWTSFLDCFTHYRTGEQAEDEAALMAGSLPMRRMREQNGWRRVPGVSPFTR
ncbi:hypothetical protein J4V80_25860, partial [Escherichia coli]